MIVPVLVLFALQADASAVSPNANESESNEQAALVAEPAIISNGTLVLV